MTVDTKVSGKVLIHELKVTLADTPVDQRYHRSTVAHSIRCLDLR